MDKIIITGNSVALDADGLANDIAYVGGGYVLTAVTVAIDYIKFQGARPTSNA